jgi:hypothetical protein
MSSKRSDDNEPKAKKPTRGVDSAIRFNARLSSSSYQKETKSGKPEAVVKVVSQARGIQVKNLMEYVARESDEKKESLEIEDELGALHEGKGEIKDVYEEWKKDFDQGKPGSKRPPRHATHITLSGNCEHTDANAKKVLAAARETAKELLDKKGHDFVMVMHRDGTKAHVHLIVKNSNREADGNMLRLNPPELLVMRQVFAEKMQDLGLEQTATLRRDRPSTLERIAKGTERLKNNDKRFMDELKKSEPNIDAFKHKKNVARAIIKTREEVYSLSPGKERADQLKALRELEKKLKEKNIDVKTEIKATVNKLGKEADKFQGYVKEFNDKDQAPMTNKELLRNRRAIEKLQTQTSRDIKNAREAISKSKAPPAEKKAALKELKQHQKQVEKSLGRGRGRGE